MPSLSAPFTDRVGFCGLACPLAMTAVQLACLPNHRVVQLRPITQDDLIGPLPPMTCQGVPELQQSHPHRILAREDLALHKGGQSQQASLWPLD